MHNNGVSHLTAANDYEGVTSIVSWLEYLPKVYEDNPLITSNNNLLFQARGLPLPVLPSIDPVEREIGFQPTKLPYDPRHMLAGRSLKGNNYMTNTLF